MILPSLSSPRRVLRGAFVVTLGIAFATLWAAAPATAHDMPDEVVYSAHVAPKGDRLHVPLRVPLALLLDDALPKRGPGYIDLAATDRLDQALTMATDRLAAEVLLFENGKRLQPSVAGWRLSVPSDRAFDDYQSAVSSIAGPPLPEETNLFWNQGYFDVHLTYPIASETSTFSLAMNAPTLVQRLHMLTTFVAPDGPARTYDLLGDMGRVELNPTPGFLFRTFSSEGWRQFVTGWEHVLFVVALAVGLSGPPASDRAHPIHPLVAFLAVSSLVVLTYGAGSGSASLFLQVLVSFTAAVTVLLVAIVNIVARTHHHRWITAAVCALPHALLLTGGLGPLLQFRAPGAVMPLIAYVVGVQAGALVVFGSTLGLGWLLTRHGGLARHGPIIAALLLGYVGWHHTLERLPSLLATSPPSPRMADLGGAARWVTLLLLVMAGLWLAFEMHAGRRGRGDRPGPAGSDEEMRSPMAGTTPPPSVEKLTPTYATTATKGGHGGRSVAENGRG